MNIFKLSIVCVAAICFAVMPAMAQNDPKAKSVLEAVTKKVNSLKSLKANFAINLSGGKGGSVKDTKKGTITLKGQKYHVNISGQEIISDNKTIWTYNKDAKEVQINNFNPDEQTMSPAKLLTNFYDKEYKYTYKGEKKEKGKSYEEIELVPTGSNKKFSKINLLVNKSTSMIAGGDILEKNGNVVKYTVSNVILNANVPDSEFTWDQKAHPGVEVVDLR